MNIQAWFPLGFTGLILQSKGLSKSFLQHHSSKASILQRSAFFMVQLSHPYMTTGETIALIRRICFFPLSIEEPRRIRKEALLILVLNHSAIYRTLEGTACIKLANPLESCLQFSSASQSSPTLCDPTDCSTPGFPVHHQLLELMQTQVHPVADAIQPSHPLSSPFPASNLPQHQGLFQWVNSSDQVTKVLELLLPHQSFQWIFRTDFFRIDWFDLAVQGTFKSLLQHHSSQD